MARTRDADETTDPIDTQDVDSNGKAKKVKNRRPANTAFRQQRLKAWQPILTPKTVLPLFFAIGIIFAPIGGALLYASAQVKELRIDYTDCFNGNYNSSTAVNIPSDKVTYSFSKSPANQPTWRSEEVTYVWHPDHFTTPVSWPVSQCTIEFEIPEQMTAPVFFYYRLTQFYQNHRRYVKSLDMDQLKGTAVDNNTISSSTCDPLRLDPNGKAYYPCGLIANSVFNDTFYDPVLLNPRNSGGVSNMTYHMENNTGIAWDSDKELYGNTSYTPSQVVPPPNWALRYPNGYTDDQRMPNLAVDQAFQVWMRTAGLPTFSKLAMRNDTMNMPQGRYQLKINGNFPVDKYGGTKSIIISTRTVMGGKNPFLGIAYVVVGGLCVLLGAIFTVAHLIKPRKLGDHTYLSWNNEQASTVTATGRDLRPE